jgi:hypothetical protein
MNHFPNIQLEYFVTNYNKQEILVLNFFNFFSILFWINVLNFQF